MIAAFEEATGVSIPYKICDRRCGDVDELWADISKAKSALNWKPTHTLADMCAHSWNWQSKNPMGYGTTGTSNGAQSLNGSANGKGPISNDSPALPGIAAPQGKALNGKTKSFDREVNNNDEDVTVF